MISKHIAYIPNSLRLETIIYSQQENKCNSNTTIGLFCVLLYYKVYICFSSSFLEILVAHYQYSTCPIKNMWTPATWVYSTPWQIHRDSMYPMWDDRNIIYIDKGRLLLWNNIVSSSNYYYYCINNEILFDQDGYQWW